MFPSITLTGILGSISTELGDLFTKPAEAWSASGGIVQPLFEGGRLSANVARTRAIREQVKADDAGVPYGAYARFWVEPERRTEFETASDERRAAWVWRAYLTAARTGDPFEIRYEAMAADPAGVGRDLARHLDAPAEPLVEALAGAHAESIGRYRTDLGPAQLAEVETEAGSLLRELGYVT